MAEGDTESTPLMSSTAAKPSTGCRMMDALRPALCELVGVIVFVFLGCTSATSGNLVSVAAAHGLTIMLLIMQFGDISGGHFNPCVTLGAFLAGGITLASSVAFWIAQLLGGIAGAALFKAVLPNATYSAINAGIPDLGDHIGIGQGIVCEAILTFTLVLTVIMTAVDRQDNAWAPAAIGLAVFVDISAAGNVSGAVMNPARAFGPAVVGSSLFHGDAWIHHYVYWIGPIAGALVAGAVHRLLLGSPNKRIFCRT